MLPSSCNCPFEDWRYNRQKLLCTTAPLRAVLPSLPSLLPSLASSSALASAQVPLLQVMPSTSSPKIVLRVCQSPENNAKASEQVCQPLSPIVSHGIVLGSGFRATFKLRDDPEVDAAHGTLERTSGLGVWVFSDHSRQGSMLNGERVHRDAAVVRHGDRLKLGHTELEVCFGNGEKDADPQQEDEEKEPIESNQETELSARSAARLARRRASTPWRSAISVSKAQQAKQRLPRIETSGLGFVEPTECAEVQPMATPPEYSASPIPGTRWRRKRNSIATTTLMAAMRSPSPPLMQQGHPHSFHRPRTRFIQGSDMPSTPPRSCPNPVVAPIGDTGKPACPPPLEYSSSPAVSPSSLAARQRHNIFQQPPSSVPIQGSGLLAGVPPPPFSAGSRPTARRDDLRIQVSKKMAAAAPASAGKANVPRVVPKVLEFQAPASPVAQRDILKQQESLQTILQHKYDEEQLLKQQQEEWMKQHLMPSSTSGSELRSGSSSSTPPLSPIKSEKELKVDPSELEFFPIQAPVLLRTLSLGLKEQRTLKPSPRLTAAIRASRARLNSFEERPSVPNHRDRRGRRKTTALVLSQKTRSKMADKIGSPVKENELRTSDESIASTATTIITCHRRVTSSLSSDSASSVDLGDFLGYEEEDGSDTVTSYTTPDLYGSAELLRRSREDTTLQFDANCNSNSSSNSMYEAASPPASNTSGKFSPSDTADTRFGSPRRRGTDTPDTSSTSSNQLLNDNPVLSLDTTISLGSRIWSPRGSHFDPQSPYKSTAAFKNKQQPPLPKLRRPPFGPEEEGEGASKPLPFRRRTSFRRHSLTPLTGISKP